MSIQDSPSPLAVLPAQPTAWRDGCLLVTFDGADLPDKCIRCGAPATNRRRIKRAVCEDPGVVVAVVGFFQPFLDLFLKFGERRVTIGAHFCDWHGEEYGGLYRRLRILAIGTACILVPAAIFLHAACLGAAIAPVLLALVAHAGHARTPNVVACHGQVVWLAGIDEQFLAQLPPWTGPAMS